MAKGTNHAHKEISADLPKGFQERRRARTHHTVGTSQKLTSERDIVTGFVRINGILIEELFHAAHGTQ
jgi:hypothetical protein